MIHYACLMLAACRHFAFRFFAIAAERLFRFRRDADFD